MRDRRFPPPWSVEEHNEACFIVRDKNGQALAYVYFEDEPGRRAAAKLLTKDEARRIAAAGAGAAGAVKSANRDSSRPVSFRRGEQTAALREKGHARAANPAVGTGI